MDARVIEHALIETTSKNSNFETFRNYISLSNCYLPAEKLIDQFKNGFQDSIPIRLKCYKGYQMEKDLISRMRVAFGDMIIAPAKEISIHDGLVKGHPDFEFVSTKYFRYPGDCKSVLRDEWIPRKGILPRKVYWQMQGYMFYSGINKSLVIYESRESGFIKPFIIYENRRIQEEIETKIETVVKQLGERYGS